MGQIDGDPLNAPLPQLGAFIQFLQCLAGNLSAEGLKEAKKLRIRACQKLIIDACLLISQPWL